MHICYLITIIWSKYLYDKLGKKIKDRLNEEGYIETEKHGFFNDWLTDAIALLLPVLNVGVPLYINKHFDEFYTEGRDEGIKKSKLRKKTEEDDIIENDKSIFNRLRIKNILSAKTLQEENKPKWKKIIENLYYQVGSILQKNNIIDSNQNEYSDELSNERNKTKRL